MPVELQLDMAGESRVAARPRAPAPLRKPYSHVYSTIDLDGKDSLLYVVGFLRTVPIRFPCEGTIF